LVRTPGVSLWCLATMPRERSLSPSNSLAIAPEAAAALPAVPNAAAVPDAPAPAVSNNNAPADLPAPGRRPEPQAGPNPARSQQGGCVSLAEHRARPPSTRIGVAHTVCMAHAVLPVCAVGVLSGSRRERVALHIKNLSIRTSERELAEYFRAAGKVREPNGLCNARRHPAD